jgi:hypothetical protein
MSDSDWIAEMFPGDGRQLPTNVDRDRADVLVVEWSVRWGEAPRTIARVHPEDTAYLAGTPTNRAFVRVQLRRWWRKP